MKNVVEIQVNEPVMVGSNGENLPINNFFRPFLSEEKTGTKKKPNQKTDWVAKFREFAKAASYACHR
ncbi:hypothetical protein [Aquimarina mytili]|uniref:Uncharacterized protein n=1 Tax=Aquimarina mytili TaxID=874423 RepID=A0A937DBU0_9FLAO|nr:hypothetical protein [Aquimarina mytili]MBL0686082.1 hypothetical protein [Aquimarina mytili]